MDTKLIHPTIRIGDATLSLPVEIESGSYLEFFSADDCKLYGPQGQLIRSVVPKGSVPMLASDENQLEFRCAAPPGRRRARTSPGRG